MEERSKQNVAIFRNDVTEHVYPVQGEPQLGGEGSGKPPRYLVACGQHGHTIAGIDIGTRYARVATVESDSTRILTPTPLQSRVYVQSDGNFSLQPAGDFFYAPRPYLGSDSMLTAPPFSYSPDELFGAILMRVRKHAESRTERPISKVVITVPSAFTNAQRKLVKKTAQDAGLDVLQLINETTAAALSFCYGNPQKEGTYLIYGLGAGTFAASVIEFHRGILEVKSTSGDSQLGGDDFDAALLAWLCDVFEVTNGAPVSRDKKVLTRLVNIVEQAKIDLTTAPETHIRASKISTSQEAFQIGKPTLMTVLTRERFAQLTKDLVDSTMRHVENVLEDSKLNATDIDHIMCVGPSTNMPVIKEALLAKFDARKFLPIVEHEYAVAGAAIQASLLTHRLRDYVVWDVLSVPVGIELKDGNFKGVITRGTPLPITAYHQFESNDATINAQVYQGVGSDVSTMNTQSELAINNCPPTADSGTKVEIAFNVRQDGIIEYSARHVGLGINLTVNVRDGDLMAQKKKLISDVPQIEWNVDHLRLARLARKLNMPVLEVPAFLRNMGYFYESINNGRAIESFLRSMRKKHIR